MQKFTCEWLHMVFHQSVSIYDYVNPWGFWKFWPWPKNHPRLKVYVYLFSIWKLRYHLKIGLINQKTIFFRKLVHCFTKIVEAALPGGALFFTFVQVVPFASWETIPLAKNYLCDMDQQGFYNFIYIKHMMWLKNWTRLFLPKTYYH